jgi:hypothetical protein
MNNTADMFKKISNNKKVVTLSHFIASILTLQNGLFAATVLVSACQTSILAKNA